MCVNTPHLFLKSLVVLIGSHCGRVREMGGIEEKLGMAECGQQSCNGILEVFRACVIN